MPTKKKTEEARIINSLKRKKENLSRDAERVKAFRSAVALLKARGIIFDQGHVLLISKQLKAVIAFDIPEHEREAKAHAANLGYHFFHITTEYFKPYAYLENVMTRIAEGRGQEIFIATDQQAKQRREDKKAAKEIHARTGGAISSKKYPARIYK